MPLQDDNKSLAYVLGVRIDVASIDVAVRKIISWAKDRESRYVCAVNVHSVVTSFDDAKHKLALYESDFNLPDGFPIAKVLNKQGFLEQQRVSGPDITLQLLETAEQQGLSVFFYGSTEMVLAGLAEALAVKYPKLSVAAYYSPPFRDVTSLELITIRENINTSGAHLVFVGLGCPKQEAWMLNQKGQVNSVMIGVGAAFEFIAGTQRRAPVWMQKIGLEWLYRGFREPRRLAWRYIRTNTIFVLKVIPEFFTKMKS